MSGYVVDENAPILVELATRPGSTVQVSMLSPNELAEISEKAINSAMNTIHNMAHRVVTAISGLMEPPSEVEVDFGLTLEMEGGVLIAKGKAGATLDVKLIWKREESAPEQ